MLFLLLENCYKDERKSHFLSRTPKTFHKHKCFMLIYKTTHSYELTYSFITFVLSLPYSLPDVTNNKVERGKITSVKVFTVVSFQNVVWLLLFHGGPVDQSGASIQQWHRCHYMWNILSESRSPRLCVVYSWLSNLLLTLSFPRLRGFSSLYILFTITLRLPELAYFQLFCAFKWQHCLLYSL